jgi:hypothetical protein
VRRRRYVSCFTLWWIFWCESIEWRWYQKGSNNSHQPKILNTSSSSVDNNKCCINLVAIFEQMDSYVGAGGMSSECCILISQQHNHQNEGGRRDWTGMFSARISDSWKLVRKGHTDQIGCHLSLSSHCADIQQEEGNRQILGSRVTHSHTNRQGIKFS